MFKSLLSCCKRLTITYLLHLKALPIDISHITAVMADLNHSSGFSHTNETTSILDQINQETESNRAEQAFWWNALGHPLATLLKTNQYSERDQRYYLH